MKKPVFTLLFMVIAGCVMAQYNGSTFAESKSSKKAQLTFLHDGAIGLVENDGQSGLLVKLMDKFSDEMLSQHGISIDVDFVYIHDFKQMMTQAADASGGVFVLSNVSITEERKNSYQFSPAYLNNVTILISQNGIPTLTNMTDINSAFKGKTAYTIANTTYHERLKQIKQEVFPAMNITLLPSANEVLDRVKGDPNAFSIVDLTYYLGTPNRSAIKRHPVGDESDDELAIAMPKSNDWAPLLNTFMNEFVNSDEYRKMVIESLGKASVRMIAYN
ncbi:MAG: transporter substrate-binding domain-containing protein [Cyclobacteriaceae bacterium]